MGLNVSLNQEYADAELDRVLNVITRPHPFRVRGATGDDSVFTKIDTTRRVEDLDLIAHAQDGVLAFGEWRLDPTDNMGQALADAWGAWRPKRIRLLGCNTALTQEGVQGMRRLRDVMGVEVLGSTAPLLVRNFGTSGLLADDNALLVTVEEAEATLKLIDADAVKHMFDFFTPYTAQSVPEIFANLLRERADLVHERQAKMKIEARQMSPTHLETTFAARVDTSDPRTAAGLLICPCVETLVDAGAGMVHRISHFYGGAFARVYTPTQPNGILLHGKYVGNQVTPL